MKKCGKLFLLMAMGCGILSSVNANVNTYACTHKYYVCSWNFDDKDTLSTAYKNLTEKYPYLIIREQIGKYFPEKTERMTYSLLILNKKDVPCRSYYKGDDPYSGTCDSGTEDGCLIKQGCILIGYLGVNKTHFGEFASTFTNKLSNIDGSQHFEYGFKKSCKGLFQQSGEDEEKLVDELAKEGIKFRDFSPFSLRQYR